MKKALFIDFEDSFSYNVVQELLLIGLEVEVKHWRDFSGEEDQSLLILGPGPGHPDDYRSIFELIQHWRENGKKIFAICLGHQILCRIRGLEVSRSPNPLHGQQVELTLPPQWQSFLGLPEVIKVQRYNSLAVQSSVGESDQNNFLVNGEIMISRGHDFISYQFHPESVGTKCRASFFRPVLRHLL